AEALCRTENDIRTLFARSSQQYQRHKVGSDTDHNFTGFQLATPPQVGEAATEYAALAELKAIAGRNKRFTSYIGMGYTA
ncbi:hypothetical protein JVW17_20490, partial [Vibrio cholerae O1]